MYFNKNTNVNILKVDCILCDQYIYLLLVDYSSSALWWISRGLMRIPVRMLPKKIQSEPNPTSQDKGQIKIVQRPRTKKYNAFLSSFKILFLPRTIGY
jgi:hypothetical protein